MYVYTFVYDSNKINKYQHSNKDTCTIGVLRGGARGPWPPP